MPMRGRLAVSIWAGPPTRAVAHLGRWGGWGGCPGLWNFLVMGALMPCAPLAKASWHGSWPTMAGLEKQLVWQRRGANALLYPNTPASGAKPGLPPALWHQGPVRLGRAVRRMAEVQEGAEVHCIYSQRACPLQALTQNSRPGLRSHDRWVQGLLSSIRGWVFLA